MSEYRIEHDSMGEVRVPADAKWRAQTQRAVENFPISGQHIERAHIEALARIKGAAAKVNARLAQDCIRSVEVLEYPELGMEAVWKIEVEDFPAFIVVDDKGNDFFQDPAPAPTFTSIPVRGPGLA